MKYETILEWITIAVGVLLGFFCLITIVWFGFGLLWKWFDLLQSLTNLYPFSSHP